MRCVLWDLSDQAVVEAELMGQNSKASIMRQPLAYIHPEAQIADNVVVEPFVTIDKNVVIEEGTWIGPHVTIMEGAHIGKNWQIFPEQLSPPCHKI